MISSDIGKEVIKKELPLIPKLPGVYRMLNAKNEILDQAGVQNVANLPTLDEARANIIGILNASASKLVSILLARSEKMSNLPTENSEKQPKE